MNAPVFPKINARYISGKIILFILSLNVFTTGGTGSVGKNEQKVSKPEPFFTSIIIIDTRKPTQICDFTRPVE